MEKYMLVLVLNPNDPQLRNINQFVAEEPNFGIVEEVLAISGRALAWQCKVRQNDGTVADFPAGQLKSLLMLSDEDATMLTPRDAFLKWAFEIVKRKAILDLSLVERDFLAELRLAQQSQA